MLRVGILGTGRMAATMARAMSGRSDMTLAAVASGTPGRAAEFAKGFGIPRAHDGRDALLADDAVDLIYVATASRSHAADSVAALSAGRAVLCEKPYALTPDEAAAVATAAASSGRFFMEGFWTLCLPSWAKLVQMAQGGTLGPAQSLSFSFGYPIDPADPAGVTAPEDGGLAFNRAGYGVALGLACMGPARAVTPVGQDPLGLTLAHDAGLTQIAVSSTSLLENTAVLGCARGAAGLAAPVIGSETLWTRQTGPVRMPDARAPGLKQRLQTKPALRRLKASRSSAKSQWLSYGDSRYGPMLGHVADCIRAGKTGSDLVPLELSQGCCEILSQVHQVPK